MVSDSDNRHGASCSGSYRDCLHSSPAIQNRSWEEQKQMDKGWTCNLKYRVYDMICSVEFFSTNVVKWFCINVSQDINVVSFMIS